MNRTVRPYSGDSWSTALLAIALGLTGATQLRLPGLAIGPGELLLLTWSMGVIANAATSRHLRIRRHAIPMLAFWVISLAILIFDLIVYEALGGRQTASYHTMLAYAFSGLACFAYALWASENRLLPLACWIVGTLVVSLTLIRIAAATGIGLGPIDPWYSIRFCGWSKNPNQIAFQLAAIPPLALYCSRSASRANVRRGAALMLPIVVIVGISTSSDALTAAWLAASVCFVAVEYSTVRRRAPGGRTIQTFVRNVALPIAAFSALLFGGAELFDRIGNEARSVYELGGQGSDRIALWNHGLDAAFTAPLLGLGPGAHSGVMWAFEGSESHNSFIDWWSNAGILGLAVYLLMLGALARPIIRARESSLSAAFVALISISVFHYTFRHPSFWIGLMLVSGLAAHHHAGRRR